MAEPADASELIRLNREFNDGQDVSDNLADVGRSLSTNPSEKVVVAEQNRQILGFATIQITHSFCYTRPTVELTEIFVPEKDRRKGVATSLIQEVVRICVDNDGLELFFRVNRQNEGAIHFYRQSGFEEANHFEYRIKFYE